MHFKSAYLFIALAACAISAQAEVVRCTGPDGKVSYSDVACPTTTSKVTAVHTEMASPGEQLDNFNGSHSASTRATQSGTATTKTPIIVVHHVIVVRRAPAPAPTPHQPAHASH
jgi:hypothetical protein